MRSKRVFGRSGLAGCRQCGASARLEAGAGSASEVAQDHRATGRSGATRI